MVRYKSSTLDPLHTIVLVVGTSEAEEEEAPCAMTGCLVCELERQG